MLLQKSYKSNVENRAPMVQTEKAMEKPFSNLQPKQNYLRL